MPGYRRAMRKPVRTASNVVIRVRIEQVSATLADGERR
jgi:hypothetical protein